MNIYLDNSATTKVAEEVLDEMKPYFLDKFGNASSIHSFGQEAKEALEVSRRIIAEAINAFPEEVIFVASGTEADNMAIRGIAYYEKEKTGKNHIITTKIEHPAVLASCRSLEKDGFKVTYRDVDENGVINLANLEEFKVTYLDVDEHGFISLAKLEKAITDKTILVSVMHANNEIGTIQDIEAIGTICKGKGVFFHTDAVQSFTKIPIDVKMQNIDLLSISAHKIHGPKGIGALYVRNGVKMHPIIYGGGQESGLRSGTENVAGAVGFAKSATLLTKEDIIKMEKLRDKIIHEALKIPDSRLNGSTEKRICNNVNISFSFVEGESLVLMLNQQGIALSTGSACSSHSLEPSHVLISIGLSPETAHGSLRISLSKYTSDAEVDYFLKILPQVVERLRGMSAINKENVNLKFEESDKHV